MEKQKIDNFFLRVEAVVSQLRAMAPKQIIILHHNDADGLSAAAILVKAFYREQIPFRRIALEKPYPAALQVIADSIEELPNTVLLFTDFASGMLETLDKIVPPQISIMVLDHHQLSDYQCRRITCLNPLLDGISGGTDATASTVCYLFSKALNPWNQDLAAIALIGVCGDRQYHDGFRVNGLNQIALADALSNGLVVQGSDICLASSQHYRLMDIASSLNALGSIGYFEGGTDIAVKGLADGWGIEADTCGKDYQERFEKIVIAFLKSVELRKVGALSWFAVPQGFPPVGVKTVGLLCEELINRGRVDDSDYVLGIQPIAPLSLGFGQIEIPEEKISMRTTPQVREDIAKGERRGLTDILPAATRAVNGFVDACHPHAAATTIPLGTRERFLSVIFKLISGA